MYLKDYNIMKINNGLRLVNQSDPDNKFDPIKPAPPVTIVFII